MRNENGRREQASGRRARCAAKRIGAVPLFGMLAALMAMIVACSGSRTPPPATQPPGPQATAPGAAPADSATLSVAGFAPVKAGTGVEKAREAAIRNAQRNAVEQGLGSLVSSATLTKNFQLVSDRIYSAADGYVSRYEVLSEGLDAAAGLYRVMIRAEVNRGRLKDDLASLKLFQQETGQRRVMLVWREEKGGVARGEGPDESALAAAGQALIEKQFRVFEQEALASVYERIRAAGGGASDEALLASALAQGAEIYVPIRVAGGRKLASGEETFSGAYATVKLKAYDCTTGRLLGTSEEKAKRIVRRVASEYDWSQGIGEAAAEAAGKAVEDLVPKIVTTVRADEETGAPYQIVFRGFTEDEADAILDTLEEDASFKSRRVLQKQRGYLEVELFVTERDAERVGRQIRAGMKEKGIAIETRELTGSRITFARPTAAGQ